MYKIECDKEFNLQLQVLPFEKRYQILLENNKKKKIVYIKNEFDNSTFRYRCYNFKESLEKNKEYDITYFLCDEIPKILPKLENIDLIVFQRTTWTIDVYNLLALARIKKIKTVYDVDDLIYKIDYIPFFINHVGLPFSKENIQLYFGMASTYEMVAKECDAYITTTPFLKEMLEKDYNKDVYVVHNFLNNEQIEASNDVIKKRKYDEEKVVIGYFSGSPSHKNDFKVVENALITLLEKYANIYVKIVGFMQLEGKMLDFQNKGRVIFKPLVPYQELQYEIGKVDINIIPLVDSNFNQSKSELKFFEAGIVKVPSCITPTKLYEEIIEDGVNGVFCSNGNWVKKLEELYLNEKLRKQIGENAYKTTCKYYLPDNQTNNIVNIYNDLLKKHN